MTGPQITVGGAPMDAPPEPEANGSLIAQLRAKAAAQIAEHTEDFMVGGEFGKQLWVRYRPLDEDKMDRFISRRAALRENPDLPIPLTALNMDMMAQSCVCVLGADAQGENKTELRDGVGIVRLEHRLAVLLALPLPEGGEQLTSREVIMLLFGGNAMAVVGHGDTLTEWMQDPAAAVKAGESSGASG